MGDREGTWDPGHGEPGHVHDEQWNRSMMATDDPPTDGTAVENEEAGGEAPGVGAGGLAGAAAGGPVVDDRAEEETKE